jgi:NAD(P)-dependent dehydrogenase (short-subunit alcohol dehydrogenase family)
MLLQDKHVLVFAASGAIAGEAARTFAAEGAVVHLSARSADAIHALADTIRANGGSATAHIVDATDERAVEAYVAQIAAEHGRIDGVFNGIGGRPSELGYPERLSALHIDQFMKPLNIVLGSTFITSRAVGLVMASQGSGAIVTLSATLSSMTAPYMSNITATCSAIEGLTRALAGDFGPAGVRVNCVRGNAMPETRTIQ